MASLIVAYVLWLFGGIFGAHHFYLKRDRQAFVWIATLGGVCGLGWLRDIWHIPRYVRECARQYNTLDSDSFVSDTNNEYDYMYSRESDDDDVNYEFVRVGQGGFDTVWTTQARGRVKVSLARYAVMFVMGLNFGSLVTMLCPQSWLQSQRIQSIFDSFISPIAVALGVDIVANIGRLQAKFDWSLAGAYAGVLGVSRSASLQEIKARYRELVLLWHPDKQADPLKRTDAHKLLKPDFASIDLLSGLQTDRRDFSELLLNMANSTVAYILWFVFGFWGVHHFYLRRDRQAFVWWATLGGVLGLGWLRDYKHLPRYIKECREDDDAYNKKGSNRNRVVLSRFGNAPTVSRKVRYAGMLVMGLNFGTLVTLLCPRGWLQRRDELGKFVNLVMVPLAVATGVHLVANIGRLRARLLWPLGGAFVGVCGLWHQQEPTNVLLATILAAVSTSLGFTPKKIPKPRQGFCRRVSRLFWWGALYLLLWGSALYFNATVTVVNGRKVPLRDVIDDFFHSREWSDIKQVLRELWQNFKDWLKQMLDSKQQRRSREEHRKERRERREKEEEKQRRAHSTGPGAETDPYKILGVGRSASQTEIKARYRKLVLIWHPDKQTDPAQKQKSHVAFMKIQQAYETLTGKHKGNGPSADKITILGNTTLIADGTNVLNLTCLATDVYPKPRYTWLDSLCRDNYRGSTCSFRPQSHNDRDTVRCRASDTFRDFPVSVVKEVTLDLQYRAKVTKFTINGTSGSLTVNEQDNVTVIFTCNARGRPAPSVTLRKYNGELLNEDGNAPSDEHDKAVSSTLVGVTSEDMGSYTCTADNNFTSPEQDKVQLNVKTAPKGNETTTKDKPRELTETGLTFTVLAYPKPDTFVFTFYGNKLNPTLSSVPSGTFKVTRIVEDPSLPVVICSIKPLDVPHDRLGVYRVEVSNGLEGTYKYFFQVKHATLLSEGGDPFPYWAIIVICSILSLAAVGVAVARRVLKGKHT
ncbi:hypothetical protein BaRGS_00025293, partial [Batillaria attramentaria]